VLGCFPKRVSSTILALAAAASFLGSLVVCVLARDFALRRALLDRPNERSLHQTPVPRLGGVAIVFACYAALGLLLLVYEGPHGLWPWLLTAAPVAALGLLDDVRPLPAALRLLIHVTIAATFCMLLPLPAEVAITPGLSIAIPGPWFVVLGTLFLVGTLNVYNFMDGMDGLAATQAVGAAFAIATCSIAGSHDDLSLLSLVFLGSASGFFVHNAPPAKLFMGDVGSTFLGFGFAAMSLFGLTRTPHPLALTPVLFALAPFLLDGGFTLLRRLSRGEKIWQAHRTHLYQRAFATGLSHHDVLVRYAAWTAFGVVTAATDVQTSGRYTLWLVVSHVACFVLVWRWVCAREQVHAREPEKAARIEHGDQLKRSAAS
jgi:UDP-N-acetylmuramyl pentapeptide phosphotransferase/UDP-N-acetylglucosamine-1-phosphate transferase